MKTVTVRMVKMAPDVPTPSYRSDHASGMDLHAYLTAPLTIAPGALALVPTGIRIAVPPGYEAQVRPRSGLVLSHGLTVANTPGTIDADYRGEIKILLANAGGAPFRVEPGMLIAQLVVAPVARAAIELAAELPPTSRGEGGFGHTGV